MGCEVGKAAEVEVELLDVSGIGAGDERRASADGRDWDIRMGDIVCVGCEDSIDGARTVVAPASAVFDFDRALTLAGGS